MRVEARHHHLALEGAALPELDPGDGAVLHADLVDLGGVEDAAAGLDDLPRQGSGELVRAALAVALVHAPIDQQGDEESHAGLPGIQSPHAGGVEQQGAHPVVLEVAGDDLERALLGDLHDLLADLGALHGHGHVHGGHRRDVGARSDDLADALAPLPHYPAEGDGVLLRELVEGVGGVFQHPRQQQRGAVLEDHRRLQVGLDPDQSVPAEVEVPEHRHVVHHHVVAGVDVGVEARIQDLLRGQSTADLVAAFDEADLETGPGEVGRGDQAVGTRSDHHHVPLALRRKLREEAPRVGLADQFLHHAASPRSWFGLSCGLPGSCRPAGCTRATRTTSRRARRPHPR